MARNVNGTVAEALDALSANVPVYGPSGRLRAGVRAIPIRLVPPTGMPGRTFVVVSAIHGTPGSRTWTGPLSRPPTFTTSNSNNSCSPTTIPASRLAGRATKRGRNGSTWTFNRTSRDAPSLDAMRRTTAPAAAALVG